MIKKRIVILAILCLVIAGAMVVPGFLAERETKQEDPATETLPETDLTATETPPETEPETEQTAAEEAREPAEEQTTAEEEAQEPEPAEEQTTAAEEALGRALYVRPELPKEGETLRMVPQTESVLGKKNKSLPKLLVMAVGPEEILKVNPMPELSEEEFLRGFGETGIVLSAQVAVDLEILDIVDMVFIEDARITQEQLDQLKGVFPDLYQNIEEDPDQLISCKAKSLARCRVHSILAARKEFKTDLMPGDECTVAFHACEGREVNGKAALSVGSRYVVSMGSRDRLGGNFFMGVLGMDRYANYIATSDRYTLLPVTEDEKGVTVDASGLGIHLDLMEGEQYRDYKNWGMKELGAFFQERFDAVPMFDPICHIGDE